LIFRQNEAVGNQISQTSGESSGDFFNLYADSLKPADIANHINTRFKVVIPQFLISFLGQKTLKVFISTNRVKKLHEEVCILIEPKSLYLIPSRINHQRCSPPFKDGQIGPTGKRFAPDTQSRL